MSRERKTIDRWDIMANYGDGWTCECSEYSLREAKAQLKTYRENCKVPVRLERRLEPKFCKFAVRMRVPQPVLDDISACSAGVSRGRYRIELQTPEKRHLVKFEVDRHAPPIVRVVDIMTGEELVAYIGDALVGTWDKLKTEYRQYNVEIAPAETGSEAYALEPVNEDTSCDGWRIIKSAAPRVVYKACLEVPEALLKKIDGFLDAKTEDEFQGEDSTISVTVEAPDGRQIDIKCCGCDDECSWTEAVLFDHGSEIDCTEPEDSIDGEWLVESDEATYIINVRPAPADGGFRVVPFNEDTPLLPGWKAIV